MDTKSLVEIILATVEGQAGISNIARNRLPYDAESALWQWAINHSVRLDGASTSCDFYRLSFPNIDVMDAFLIVVSVSDPKRLHACAIVQSGAVIGEWIKPAV